MPLTLYPIESRLTMLWSKKVWILVAAVCAVCTVFFMALGGGCLSYEAANCSGHRDTECSNIPGCVLRGPGIGDSTACVAVVSWCDLSIRLGVLIVTMVLLTALSVYTIRTTKKEPADAPSEQVSFDGPAVGASIV